MFKKILITLSMFVTGSFASADINKAVDKTSATAKEVIQQAREGKPPVGVRLGFAEGSGNFTEGFDYGIEAGSQLWQQVSGVLELSGMTMERTGEKPGLTRTKLLAKAMYNFGGDIPVIRYSYLGAGVGPVYDNVRNEGKWNIGLSPQAGFDIPVGSDKLSLGANVAMLFVTGGTPETFSASGVAKYWF